MQGRIASGMNVIGSISFESQVVMVAVVEAVSSLCLELRLHQARCAWELEILSGVALLGAEGETQFASLRGGWEQHKQQMPGLPAVGSLRRRFRSGMRYLSLTAMPQCGGAGLRAAGAGLRAASRAHGGDTDGAAAGRERAGARRGGGGLEARALGPHGSRSRLAQDKMEDQS